VADKDAKKDSPKDDPSLATPRFDPKPVQVGGESIVDRLYPYRKKIGFFVLSGFAIWGVIAVVIHFKNAKSEKRTDKLADVLDLADHQVRPPNTPADPKSKEETFADPTERANKLLAELSKEGTNAAGPTYRASLLVQAGKLDDAIAEYRKVSDPGLDGVLAREGLGLAIEMKAEGEKDATARQKGLEDALATFKTMQPDEKGPRAAFAFYHQGRVLVLLGKRDDAKTALEKAKELGKDVPELPELIDERLSTL
jgi:hypothetical protein